MGNGEWGMGNSIEGRVDLRGVEIVTLQMLISCSGEGVDGF